MIRAAVAALLCLGAGVAAAGESSGNGGIIDLRTLLVIAPDRENPGPGIEHVVSGGSLGWWDDVEEEPRIPDVFEALVSAGHEGLDDLEILPGRLLLAGASEGLRHDLESLTADAFRAVRIEFELRRPDGTITTGRIVTKPGRWESWSRGRLRRLLTDFDVEIACDNSGGFGPSAVGDPLPRNVREGTLLRVRPALVDGGRRVALEVSLHDGRIREVEKVHTRARYLGILDRPTYDGATAMISGAVDGGKPLVARFRTPEGETVLTLVPHVLGEAGRGRVRLLDASLLLRPGLDALLPGFDLLDDEDFESAGLCGWAGWHAHRRPLLDGSRRDEGFADEAFDEIGAPRSAQVAAVFPGRLLLAGDAAKGAADALARRTARRARTIRTEVTIRAGDAIIARADVSSLDGRASAARLGTDEAYLADYDVEVGCYIQIADPIVDTLFAGWIVRSRPRIGPDGKTVRLDVVLVRQERDTGLGAREVGDVVNGILHHPTVHARDDRLDLVVGDGETVRVPLGRGPDGREREAEIRATID